MDVKKRLKQVRDKIKSTALKCGRKPEDIKLVAVSKNQSVEKIKFLIEQGIITFGENRVQELRDKKEIISNLNINWHFIGHLQRNKVKYLMRMENCRMIQSLDSWRLAKEINKRAKKNERVITTLVEVNISGDESKFGIKPGETLNFLNRVEKLSNIRVAGLMAIAPYLEDHEEVRPYFKQMARLRKKANNNDHNLKELSMGMSNDYQVAIEEGATIVRIGTAIFGARNYK